MVGAAIVALRSILKIPTAAYIVLPCWRSRVPIRKAVRLATGKISHFNWRSRHPQTADADLMVPIPTHWKRRFLSNGFHAPSLIAQNVEKMTGIPQSQRILRAVKPTLKQGTLSRTARLKNVRDAFVCKHPGKVARRTVMLVDDVMTSGATMIEAARVLKRAGAKKVIVAVIARATSVG